MNRILRRPMFRMGGSSGTGITSGLDQPKAKRADFTIDDAMSEENRKLREAMAAYQRYKMSGGTMSFEQFIRMTGTGSFNTGGRVGYQQGSMPTFQAAGFPGFLTSLGLNILATPPQGNIFATTATAARDPFAQLQADQMAARRLQGEKDFLRSERLAGEKFEESQLEKRLKAQEKIAGMDTTDMAKRIEAEKLNFDNNEIKAARAVNFYDNKFNELEGEYGDEGVFITPVDLSIYEKESPKLTDKELRKFVQQNSRAGRQVIYDVSTNRAVRLLVNKETGLYEVRPADPTQIDDVGEIMPDPDKPTAGLFGQKTKPDVVTPKIKELGEEFSEEMYQTP